MLYSGIDLHKRSLVIHTLDADRTTSREAQLKSDRAAVLAYFGTLASPNRAVVECVQSWYWLRDLLGPTGVDLRLAHAKYVKAISYAKVKTDRVDARMLAQLLRAGLVPEAHMIGAALSTTQRDGPSAGTNQTLKSSRTVTVSPSPLVPRAAFGTGSRVRRDFSRQTLVFHSYPSTVAITLERPQPCITDGA